jgi:hypothetical protein
VEVRVVQPLIVTVVGVQIVDVIIEWAGVPMEMNYVVTVNVATRNNK